MMSRSLVASVSLALSAALLASTMWQSSVLAQTGVLPPVTVDPPAAPRTRPAVPSPRRAGAATRPRIAAVPQRRTRNASPRPAIVRTARPVARAVPTIPAGPINPTPPTGVIGQPPAPYAGGQVGSGARLGSLGNRDIFSTPFNVASYTDQLIRDQQAQSVIDVIENDPSVRAAASQSDGLGTTLYLRGFPLLAIDFAFDNHFGILDVRRPPLHNVERVEVLKGPSTFVNGAPPFGGVGGTINYVPKRAADEPLTRVTPFFISQGQFGTALDIGRRYGDAGEWGIRANGVYQKGNTAIDRERLDLGFGSLGLDYRGERLRLSFDLSYQDTYYKQNRSAIFILPGIAIPRSPRLTTNLSQPGEYEHTRSLLGATRFEYDVSDSTTLFGGFGYGRTDEDALSGLKTIFNSRGDYFNNFIRQNYEATTYAADVGIRSQFDTGPIRHNVTLALNGYWYDFNYSNPSQFLAANPSNIYNPVRTGVPIYSDLDVGTIRLNSYINRSFVFSDTLSVLDDRVLLTVGGRVQQLYTKSFVSAVASPTFGLPTSRYNETAVTPAVGLVVKPLDGLSLYGNYVESLQTAGTAPALASNAGEALAPLIADQKEVGVKYDFGRFGMSAALFEINRPSAFIDPTTLRFESSGLQRNRGVEFNVFGEPLQGVRLLGGLALIDARLPRAGGTFDNNFAPAVPEVNLNLYGEYDLPRWLLPGLTATGKLIYTSSQFYDQANTQKIPDWTRFDAGLRYTFTGHWGKPVTLRANVVNVFNTKYWASTGLTVLSQGTPRTYLLSAQMDF